MREKSLANLRERILAKWQAKANVHLFTARPKRPLTTPIKQADRK